MSSANKRCIKTTCTTKTQQCCELQTHIDIKLNSKIYQARSFLSTVSLCNIVPFFNLPWHCKVWLHHGQSSSTVNGPLLPSLLPPTIAPSTSQCCLAKLSYSCSSYGYLNDFFLQTSSCFSMMWPKILSFLDLMDSTNMKQQKQVCMPLAGDEQVYPWHLIKLSPYSMHTWPALLAERLNDICTQRAYL